MGRDRSDSFPAPAPSADALLDGALRRAFSGRRPRGTGAPRTVREGIADRRYRILGRLGRGGVGVVLRAHDAELDREVALKVLSREHGSGTSVAARLLEEARIAGRLQHPGIVPVYELGELRGGRPYFTMRPVEGRTLRDLLATRDEPTRDRAALLRIFERVCQTVAYAHARGVVHRDLKPSNILVGSFGEVQVLDWGFAKELAGAEGGDAAGRGGRGRGRAHARGSSSGAAIGTPAYMPPEQASGDLPATDERSDVFALGAILCEILTGDPPYRGEDADGTLRAAGLADLEEAGTRLAASGADPELVELARRCLQPDRRSRPASGAVVAEAVADHIASLERRMRDAEIQAARAGARADQERRQRRLVAGLGLSVAALAVVAGAWLRQTEAATHAERERRERWVARRLDAADGFADGGEFGRAAEELGRTAERIEGEPIDGETRSLVEERLREYRTRAASAALVRRIQAIRSTQDLGGGSADREYEAAFDEAGLDVDATPPAEAARRILAAGGESATQLVRGLDHWLSRSLEDRARASALVAVANLADPDPWRVRLRLSLRERDAEALRALAVEVEETHLRPESVVLLGRALADEPGIGDLAAAEDALRRGSLRHPGDVWIRFHLALVAARRPGGDPEDAVLHARIAHALWPENPVVRSALAFTLARRALADPGREADAAEARRIAESVVAGDPGLVLARIALCGCLLREDEAGVAARLAGEIRRERPGSPVTAGLLDALFRGR